MKHGWTGSRCICSTNCFLTAASRTQPTRHSEQCLKGQQPVSLQCMVKSQQLKASRGNVNVSLHAYLRDRLITSLYPCHTQQVNTHSSTLWVKHFHFCFDKQRVLTLANRKEEQSWGTLTVSGKSAAPSSLTFEWKNAGEPQWKQNWLFFFFFFFLRIT